jgi:tetratricopeptide (TPR) repeat protein
MSTSLEQPPAAAPGSGATPAKRKPKKRADGEGSIRWSETKKLWIGRLMVGNRLDGKPDIREVSAKTQKACRERLDALKASSANGTLPSPALAGLTVGQFLDRWLGATRPNLRQSTYPGRFTVRSQGDYSTARTLHEESLTISREIGDQSGIAGSLGCLGIVAHYEGDYPAARTLHENSLAISEAICDRRSIAGSLINLGAVTESEGNNIDAIDLYTRSLTIQRDIGDRHGVAVSLSNLGSVALAMGDFPRARDHFEESLGILRDLGRLADIAWSLEGLASVTQGEKQPERPCYQTSAPRMTGRSRPCGRSSGRRRSRRRGGPARSRVSTRPSNWRSSTNQTPDMRPLAC